jgi:methionine synthase II (cobalamin-independent)
MSIIERLEEYITSKNISIRQFEMNIGTSNGVIHTAIKNRKDIRSSWISKIIEKYPDLNAEWLITGKGSMLRKKDRSTDNREDYLNQFAFNLKQDIEDLKNRIEKLENLNPDIKK